MNTFSILHEWKWLITRIHVHTLVHGNCMASITSRISYDDTSLSLPFWLLKSLSCLIVNTLKFPTIVCLRLFHRFEPPAQGLEPFLWQSSQHPSPEICCCQGLLMPKRVGAWTLHFFGFVMFSPGKANKQFPQKEKNIGWSLLSTKKLQETNFP